MAWRWTGSPVTRRLAPALFLLLALAVPSAGEEVVAGEVVVATLPALPTGRIHGYHELRFRVENLSPDRPHTVTVEAPATDGAGAGGLRRISRTAVVAPGTEIRLSLLQPAVPSYGSGVAVVVDGERAERRLSWIGSHPDSWQLGSGGSAPSPGARILIGRRATSPATPSKIPGDKLLEAEPPAADWSGHWLAYSGYDGVVLTAGEATELPVPAAEALWRYVEAGGNLLLLGSAGDHPFFAGRGGAVEEAGLVLRHAGFGIAMAIPAGSLDVLPAESLERVREEWRRSLAPWMAVRDAEDAHRLFPVVEEVTVPVRGLFLLVLVFTLLVGPVNLLYLRRRGRRLWLLWTVPAASLVTCLAVMLYAFLGEGWLRQRRTEAVTILVQSHRRATTFAWSAFYATLTPGDGLRFDADTELSPLVAWFPGGPGAAGATVDWTQGQHLASGWLTARLPSYLVLRKSELRRERLELRQTAGNLTAVNGLGVDLENLWVADDEGRIWRAEGPVAAGAATPLRRTPKSAAGGADALRRLYRGEVPALLATLEANPADHLQPGSYLAVTAAAPFVEPGLEAGDPPRERSVIYGLLQPLLPSTISTPSSRENRRSKVRTGRASASRADSRIR
jgi:hypothetical protein